MADNFDAWDAEMARIERAIPEAIRDLHVGGLVAAYETAIERTPVRTGALRAENIILSNGRILYEAPNRPGPDAPVEFVPGGSPLAPPSPGDAKAALSSIEPFGVETILNQRHYSQSVHDGDQNRGPQPWLQHAADTYERAVEGGAKGLDERLR